MLWLTLPLLGLLSWTLSEIIRQSAIKKNLLALPNHRSSHSIPTPTSGGVGFVISILIICIIFASISNDATSLEIVTLGLCASAIAVVGYLDDRKHVPAKYRLLVHLTASVALLVAMSSLPSLVMPFGTIETGLILIPLYILGLVWLLNLYNFMDGIDGIAGMEAITTALGVSILLALNGYYQWSWILVALVVSVAGFLLLNWAPAKIFMGDVGSGFLGFVMGALALLTAAYTDVPLWCWLILLAFFITDASITLSRRALQGQPVYKAHRDHAYQILARRWHSHGNVTLLVMAINICWLFPLSVIVNQFPEQGLWVTLIAYFPLSVFVYKIGAGAVNNQSGTLKR